MARVRVYGHSDDCIEIDGDLCDEFGAYNATKYLHFSDGTVLKMAYGDGDRGIWRIERVKEGTAEYHHEPCPETEDDDPYSDQVVLNGDLRWVECWRGMQPTREELVEELEDCEYSKVSDADLFTSYRLLAGHK